MSKRIVFCAVLAWVVSSGAAHAQGGRPGAISSGLGGFGFSPMVGTIGQGASYNGYGYVFIPNLGYVPAYSSATLRFQKYGHGSRSMPSADSTEDGSALLTFRVPYGAEVSIEGRKLDVLGGTATYHSQPLQPGTHTGTVVLRWVDGSQPVERTHKIKVQPGLRRTFDFTAPPGTGAKP